MFSARIVDFGGADAVDLADKLWRQDFCWVAFGVQMSVFEDDRVVAVPCNKVQVVQDNDSSVADFSDDTENLVLVFDIEVVGGLIKKDAFALLSE